MVGKERFYRELSGMNFSNDYLGSVYDTLVDDICLRPEFYLDDCENFDNNALAMEVEETYPNLSQEYYDGYTYADEFAMAFMFSYCTRDGLDYKLP